MDSSLEGTLGQDSYQASKRLAANRLRSVPNVEYLLFIGCNLAIEKAEEQLLS